MEIRVLCPREKLLFTLKSVFKPISQLILNTERSCSGLLICGCLRLLLNLLKLVMFEAPENVSAGQGL
jgi:hypothetical protein